MQHPKKSPEKESDRAALPSSRWTDVAEIVALVVFAGTFLGFFLYLLLMIRSIIGAA